jgi:outer membrane lipase/esterase
MYWRHFSGAVRHFRIVVGLGAVAAAVTSSAWAETCALSDTLTDILQPVRGGVEQALPPGPVGVPPGRAQQGPDFTPPGLQPVPPTPGTAPPAPPVPVDRESLDRSVASLCSALKGLGLSSGLTVLSVSGFSSTIMARLDSGRMGGGSAPGGAGGGGDGKMALGALQKSQPAPQPGALGPWTVYASGSLLGGNSHDSPAAAGFTYGATSGMIGLEYSVNRYLILGLAGSFARLEADTTTDSTTDADVIHGALYLSYATRQWFFDALAAYGNITLDMARPGAVETVHGSTGVSAVGLAARTGYLFDLGKVRIGPIAGISFVTGRVGGYTEAGGDPTALQVDAQTVESLTGSAGIRLLAPFQMGGTLFVPYMNITLEHLFGDGTGSVKTSLTQAPGAPVSLSVPIFGARDYGKIEGGLTIELAPEASVNLSGASTFAREDGHDYRFSAGLSWRF